MRKNAYKAFLSHHKTLKDILPSKALLYVTQIKLDKTNNSTLNDVMIFGFN